MPIRVPTYWTSDIRSTTKVKINSGVNAVIITVNYIFNLPVETVIKLVILDTYYILLG